MNLLENYSLRDIGVTLYTDDLISFSLKVIDDPAVIDIETDEKDNFVGLGICQNATEVFYFTKLNPRVIEFLQAVPLIGHNIKADLHWMKLFGINIEASKIFYDTMLASYVLNPVRESQGLKPLAKELLDFVYPTYREIVGKGKSKVTLDRQPVELVANYCGSDALATFKLYQHFKFSADEQKVFDLEMEVMRLLYVMEERGVTVDIPYLKQLNVTFSAEIKELQKKVEAIAGHPINLNSPQQMVAFLYEQLGLTPIYKRTKRKDRKTGKISWIEGPTTDKAALQELEGMHDVIPHVMRFRELSKLNSTYVNGILELPTLPKVHTTFNQVAVNEEHDDWAGIRTGRLSSSGPNLHSIPTRTETGNMLRKAFVITDPDTVILCFDYSQIEYRLLAHFTKEPVLLQAFRTGKDVHEETGRMFGVERYLGKTLNFAAIYGAQAKKMALTAKITRDKAQELLDQYWSKLPYVKSWISVTKLTAAKRGYVTTLMGRKIPILNIRSGDKLERWKAERQAVNYIIQGSAADIIKLAMVKCWKQGFLPILQVHDELLFEVPAVGFEPTLMAIRQTMESILPLYVPLVADFGLGLNWAEAKEH